MYVQRDGSNFRLDPMPIEMCIAAYEDRAPSAVSDSQVPVPSVAGE